MGTAQQANVSLHKEDHTHATTGEDGDSDWATIAPAQPFQGAPLSMCERPLSREEASVPHWTAPDSSEIDVVKHSAASDSRSNVNRSSAHLKRGCLSRYLGWAMHRFVGIKQPAEEAKDTPPRGNRWATSCARLLGRRVGAMAAFTAVLAVLVVPLHKLVEFSTYDFGAMKFDWATTPRDHLLPVDPAYSDFNVLLDGHAHTTVSDGRLSPEQLVEYSIAQGYNAIVVTDHNTVAGGLRAEKYAASKYPSRFVVIPGMEYSNCRIHMNFINLNTTVTVGNKAFPSDDDIRHAIARVHELGGLAIVNHIPWSNHTLDRMKAPRLINHPSLQSLVDWGVDGFEIANQATFDMPTYQYIVSQNAAVRTTVDPPARLILMTGSDVHTPGNAFAWTVLKAPSFTKEAIVQEIKHARTSFLFDPTGNSAARFPRYSARYLALAPLSELAQYFEGFVDRHQGQYSFHGTRCQRDVVDIHGTSIACFVAYFIAAAILFELLYRLLGCFWRRVVRLLRRTKNQQ